MPDPRARPRLRRTSFALVGALVLQSLLGIFANLFITLPEGHTVVSAITGYPVIAAHVVLGILMLLMGAGLIVLAHRGGFRTVRTLAIFELIFLAVAVQEGFAFTATGDGAFSFGMEVGFVLAFATVAAILYQLGGSGPDVPTEGIPTSV